MRARNCLKKMQIRTLGDLLKVSEAELLSYKNFGETSLVEIKKMLTMKGLRLGQNLETHYNRVRDEIIEQLKDQASEAVLNRPISQLELSVRSRKASIARCTVDRRSGDPHRGRVDGCEELRRHQP